MLCLNVGYLQIIQKVLQSSQLIGEKEGSKHTKQRPEVSAIFKALSDDKSLTLFNMIAVSSVSGNSLARNLGVTMKQYYSRVDRLSTQGLVARKNGKYYLSTMGKIVYELQKLAGTAVNNYWKLRAIDSLRIQNQVPEDRITRLVETLVENQGLRDIILRS
jgi:hypothetical protein